VSDRRRARQASNGTEFAWCLDAHDLSVLSKCVASRGCGWDYAGEALETRSVQADLIFARLPDMPVTDELRDHIEKRLRSFCQRRKPRQTVTQTRWST
jgi:hypothetical protein